MITTATVVLISTRLDGSDLTVRLGGIRGAEEDITFWFKYDEQSPWDAGPECMGPEECDQIGFVYEDKRIVAS